MRGAITTLPCVTLTPASSNFRPTWSPAWAISNPASSLKSRLQPSAKLHASASARRRQPESRSMLSAGIQCPERPWHNCSLSRFSRRFFHWALFYLPLLFAALLAVPASARTLRIRDFHAELDVLPDSSLDVTETLRVDFEGAWQGIYRTI